jgi:predicted patatin/cPLA2 family phospholipase
MLKEKSEKEKLKEMGVKNRHDLHELKDQRYKLIKILKDLYEKHTDLVDNRISKSKEYVKSIQHEIKSPKKRLEHFTNIATNAVIARII